MAKSNQLIIAELPSAKRASGALWVRKSGNLSMPPSVHTLREGGNPKATRRGEENAIFSWREIARCFLIGQPVFFLRTFALIVSAHPYCARILRRHVIH